MRERNRQRQKAKWMVGRWGCVRALGVKRKSGEREGWREGAREAVIKSDCIASRMSQESRISGDVKPCLTPQLDNCGCGS